MLRIIEQRENSTRRIGSIDTAATPGVEVRCEIGGRQYAIEHTTLDPYPDRRADDRRFLEVMEPLAKELNDGELPTDRRYRLFTDIRAFRPFKKRELASIRERLCGWVLANANLEPPSRRKAAVIWGYPPELPVRAMLQCCEARGAMTGKLHVGRLAPENLEDLRLERIRATIESKGPKLEAEGRAGAVSVLVLENSEIAISNHILIAECVHRQFDSSGYAVDEIYLVETDWSTEWLVHTLKLGGARWPTDTDNPPIVAFAPAELIEPSAG